MPSNQSSLTQRHFGPQSVTDSESPAFTFDKVFRKHCSISDDTGSPGESKSASSGLALPLGWMALIIILCIFVTLAGAAFAFRKRKK